MHVLLDDQDINNNLLTFRLKKLLPTPQITAVTTGEAALALLLTPGAPPPYDVCFFDEILGPGDS